MALTSFHVPTAHAVVFGMDDRTEIYNSPTLNREVSPAIALLVSPVFLISDPLGFLMDFPKISDSSEVALCKGERFYGQPTASVSCTGFLVASDLLITAGHCMTHYNTTITNGMTPQCSDFKWAFDYKYENAAKPLSALISTENIANCKEVIYANFMYEMNDPSDSSKTIHGEDIALIRLDRHIHRPALKVQTLVKQNETIATVGHPTGLPQKATLNGRVLDTTTHPYYFTMNLDVFGGNSGSPILNSKNEAIGVIVRAFPSLDYIYSEKDQCSRPNKCTPDLKTCDDKDEKEGTVMYSHGQFISNEILELIKNNAQPL
ncbi:MAG: serine protease [Bdellovibrionaceae bacterium]|nr:serine protease [Pseudobdellovibrionaceae bacterium]